MIPAFEIMVLTPAIRNLIREGKVHQINGIIYTSAAENMIAMDSSSALSNDSPWRIFS